MAMCESVYKETLHVFQCLQIIQALVHCLFVSVISLILLKFILRVLNVD